MNLRSGAGLWVAFLGCSNVSPLGRLPVVDGAADVPAAVDAPAVVDALAAAPAERCVPAGTVFGRAERVVPGVERRAPRVLSITTVRMGTDLRVSTAVAQRASLVWAVSDDRCGRRGNGLWWGVQLGELAIDPDRPTPGEVHWSCLRETWSGVVGRPLLTSAGLGVMTLQHSILRASGRWDEASFVLGAVVDDPPEFASTFDPGGLQTSAQFAVRDDGVDVIYRTRRMTREYARLDASLNPVADPVVLGPGGEDLNGASAGPQPWGDGRFIAAWTPVAEAAGSDRYEVFTADGRVVDRWRLDERVGLPGVRMTTRWMASSECGVEFVAVEGLEDTTRRAFHGRWWRDGRWSLQPLSDGLRIDRVAQVGVLRVATLVDPGSLTVSLLGFDEQGAVVMGPTVIDRGHSLGVGDLIPVPGTGKLALLYSSRESQDDPVLARVALIAIDPVP